MAWFVGFSNPLYCLRASHCVCLCVGVGVLRGEGAGTLVCTTKPKAGPRAGRSGARCLGGPRPSASLTMPSLCCSRSRLWKGTTFQQLGHALGPLGEGSTWSPREPALAWEQRWKQACELGPKLWVGNTVLCCAEPRPRATEQASVHLLPAGRVQRPAWGPTAALVPQKHTAQRWPDSATGPCRQPATGPLCPQGRYCSLWSMPSMAPCGASSERAARQGPAMSAVLAAATPAIWTTLRNGP